MWVRGSESGEERRWKCWLEKALVFVLFLRGLGGITRTKDREVGIQCVNGVIFFFRGCHILLP